MENIEDFLNSSKPTATIASYLDRLIYEALSNTILTAYSIRKQIQIEQLLEGQNDDDKINLEFAKVMDVVGNQVEREYKNVLIDIASRSK